MTIGLDSAAYQQLTCWLTVNFECECRSQQRRRMIKLNSQTKALRGPIGSADVDAAAESSRVATARLSSVACVFSLALDAKRQSEISQ